MLPRRLSFLPCCWLGRRCAGRGLSDGDARRFLAQASFGPTTADVAALSQMPATAGCSGSSLSGSDYVAPHVDPDSSKGCPTGSPETCKRDNYTLFPSSCSSSRTR